MISSNLQGTVSPPEIAGQPMGLTQPDFKLSILKEKNKGEKINSVSLPSGNRRLSKRGKQKSVSQKLLTFGFSAAILLSAISLLMSAWYLFSFLTTTNLALDTLIKNASNSDMSENTLYILTSSRVGMTRLAFLSCGIFVGMSFGFLGFALFLMGIKEEMNMDAQYQSFKVKMARMSPGLFVILCASILIGVCMVYQQPVNYSYQEVLSKKPMKADKVNPPDLGDDDQP